MGSYFSQGPEREPEKPIVPEGLKRVGNPGKGSSSPQLSSRDRREMSPHAVPEIKKGTVKKQRDLFENQGKGSSSPQLLARDGREIPPHAVPEVKKGTVKEQTESFENQGRTVEENKRAMEDMLKQNLHEISQQMQTLQEAFRSMQDSTRHDLEHLKTHLRNEQGRTVKTISTGAMESMGQKDLQQLSQQPQTQQTASQTTLGSKQSKLQSNLREDQENELDLSELLSYKGKHRGDNVGDVTLDADTAHPRLEISADGQKVKDTGVIRQVPSNEKRFDSHLFVLAKEGYTSGKHYWEVYVGRRRSWALGIAWESVARKGPLTLCPQNGFWAIGLADGRDCWAYTDRWTRLTVSGHLHKIGIFLNIPAKQVTFYHADKRAALYTFSIGDGSSQEGKLIPFFSTGPVTAEPDPEPLLIV